MRTMHDVFNRELASSILQEANDKIRKAYNETPPNSPIYTVCICTIVRFVPSHILHDQWEAQARQRRQIVDMIQERIHPEVTVRGWVFSKGVYLNTQEAQLYRLRWLDRLIAECNGEPIPYEGVYP